MLLSPTPEYPSHARVSSKEWKEAAAKPPSSMFESGPEMPPNPVRRRYVSVGSDSKAERRGSELSPLP